MAISYRVKICKGDQNFEAEGDKKFVLEMLKRFENPHSQQTGTTQKGKAASKSPSPGSLSDHGKDLSVGEFIRGLEMKKHTDIVVALGYYLEKYSNKPNFTPADINNAYYEAKLDPSNTSQMFILNIKRGYLMAAKTAGDSKSKKKHYTLTRSGEDHVNKFLDTKDTK